MISAYNEEKSLARLIDRYAAATIAAGFSPESFQLVVVNNDSTVQLAAEAYQNH